MVALVHDDICIGCGACERICPQVFRIEGPVAWVTVDASPREAEENCRQAWSYCPVEAITLEDE